MTQNVQRSNGRFWTAVTVGAAALAVGVGYLAFRALAPAAADAQQPGDNGSNPSAVAVQVVHPRKGAMERTTVQPGTVQAFQSADLYGEVSGYLKELNVDIGDEVHVGQVLAKIDVPELEKRLKSKTALLVQAQARVRVAKAHVATAEAQREAAKAGLVQAQATYKSDQAWQRFRNKQLARMEGLAKDGSIKGELVDESREQYEASAEKTNAAQAAISTAKANVTAAEAKIEQANADVAESKAEVTVAEADMEQAEVLVRFATLTSPYNGVITRRTVFPGDFIRAATGGSPQLPLLSVERTDKMRVVVQVPDRDVPYTTKGKPAVVEIDALPGKKFQAPVARTAASEDPETRLMHVEIDLLNPKGQLHQGMYGKVTIVLDQGTDLLSIPSSCLIGKTQNGLGTVYVVRDGRARRVQVAIGTDNGGAGS